MAINCESVHTYNLADKNPDSTTGYSALSDILSTSYDGDASVYLNTSVNTFADYYHTEGPLNIHFKLTIIADTTKPAIPANYIPPSTITDDNSGIFDYVGNGRNIAKMNNGLPYAISLDPDVEYTPSSWSKISEYKTYSDLIKALGNLIGAWYGNNSKINLIRCKLQGVAHSGYTRYYKVKLGATFSTNYYLKSGKKIDNTFTSNLSEKTKIFKESDIPYYAVSSGLTSTKDKIKCNIHSSASPLTTTLFYSTYCDDQNKLNFFDDGVLDIVLKYSDKLAFNLSNDAKILEDSNLEYSHKGFYEGYDGNMYAVWANSEHYKYEDGYDMFDSISVDLYNIKGCTPQYLKSRSTENFYLKHVSDIEGNTIPSELEDIKDYIAIDVNESVVFIQDLIDTSKPDVTEWKSSLSDLNKYTSNYYTSTFLFSSNMLKLFEASNNIIYCNNILNFINDYNLTLLEAAYAAHTKDMTDENKAKIIFYASDAKEEDKIKYFEDIKLSSGTEYNDTITDLTSLATNKQINFNNYLTLISSVINKNAAYAAYAYAASDKGIKNYNISIAGEKSDDVTTVDVFTGENSLFLIKNNSVLAENFDDEFNPDNIEEDLVVLNRVLLKSEYANLYVNPDDTYQYLYYWTPEIGYYKTDDDNNLIYDTENAEQALMYDEGELRGKYNPFIQYIQNNKEIELSSSDIIVDASSSKIYSKGSSLPIRDMLGNIKYDVTIADKYKVTDDTIMDDILNLLINKNLISNNIILDKKDISNIIVDSDNILYLTDVNSSALLKAGTSLYLYDYYSTDKLKYSELYNESLTDILIPQAKLTDKQEFPLYSDLVSNNVMVQLVPNQDYPLSSLNLILGKDSNNVPIFNEYSNIELFPYTVDLYKIETVIQGKVSDGITGKEIEVNLSLGNSNYSTTSDIYGNFDFTLPSDELDANIPEIEAITYNNLDNTIINTYGDNNEYSSKIFDTSEVDQYKYKGRNYWRVNKKKLINQPDSSLYKESDYNKTKYVANGQELKTDDIIVYRGIIKKMSGTGIVFEEPNTLYSPLDNEIFKLEINLKTLKIYKDREIRETLTSKPVIDIEEGKYYVSRNIKLSDGTDGFENDFKNIRKGKGLVEGINADGSPIYYTGNKYYNIADVDPILDDNYMLIYDTRDAKQAKFDINSATIPDKKNLICNNRVMTHSYVFVSAEEDTKDKIFSYENDITKAKKINDKYVYNVSSAEQAKFTQFDQNLIIKKEVEIEGESKDYYFKATSTDKDNISRLALAEAHKDSYGEYTYKIVHNSYIYVKTDEAIFKTKDDEALYDKTNSVIIDKITYLNSTDTKYVLIDRLLKEEDKVNVIYDNIVSTNSVKSTFSFTGNGLVYYKPPDVTPAVLNGKYIYQVDGDQALYDDFSTDNTYVMNNLIMSEDDTQGIIYQHIMEVDNFSNYVFHNYEKLYHKSTAEYAKDINDNFIYDTYKLSAHVNNDRTLDDVSKYVLYNIELQSFDNIIITRDTNEMYFIGTYGAKLQTKNNRYQYTVLEDSKQATLLEDKKVPDVYSIVSETDQIIDNISVIWDEEGKLYDYDTPSAVQNTDKEGNNLWITDFAQQATLKYELIPDIDELICNNREVTTNENIVVYSALNLLVDSSHGEQAMNSDDELLFNIVGAEQATLVDGKYPATNTLVVSKNTTDNIPIKDEDSEYVVSDQSGNLYFTKGLPSIKDSNGADIFSTIASEQAELIDDKIPDINTLIVMNRVVDNIKYIMSYENKLYYTKYATQSTDPITDELLYDVTNGIHTSFDPYNDIPSFTYFISSRNNSDLTSQKDIVTDGVKLYDSHGKFSLIDKEDNKLLYDVIYDEPLQLGENTLNIPDANNMVANNKIVDNKSQIIIKDDYLLSTVNASVNTDDDGNEYYIIKENAQRLQLSDTYTIYNVKSDVDKGSLIGQDKLKIQSMDDIFIREETGSVYCNKNANQLKDNNGNLLYKATLLSKQYEVDNTDLNLIDTDNLMHDGISIDNLDFIEIDPDTLKLYFNKSASPVKIGDANIYNPLYTTQLNSDNVDQYNKEDLVYKQEDTIDLDTLDYIYTDENNNIWDTRDASIKFVDGKTVIDKSTAYPIYLKENVRLKYNISDCDIIYTKSSCMKMFYYLDCVFVYNIKDTVYDWKIDECVPVYSIINCQLRYDYSDLYPIYSKSTVTPIYDHKLCENIYTKDSCKKTYSLKYAKPLWNKDTCTKKFTISTCDKVYWKSTCKKDCDVSTCKIVYDKSTVEPVYDKNTIEPVYLKENCFKSYRMTDVVPIYNKENCSPCYLKKKLKPIYVEEFCDICYDIDKLEKVYLLSTAQLIYNIEDCLPVYNKNDDDICRNIHNCHYVYKYEDSYPVYQLSDLYPLIHTDNCSKAYDINDDNIKKVYYKSDCQKRYDIDTCSPIYDSKFAFPYYNWDECEPIYTKKSCTKIRDITTGFPVYTKNSCQPIYKFDSSVEGTIGPLHLKPKYNLGEGKEAKIIWDVETCKQLYKVSDCDKILDFANSKNGQYPQNMSSIFEYIKNISEGEIIITLSNLKLLTIINRPNNWINPVKVGYASKQATLTCLKEYSYEVEEAYTKRDIKIPELKDFI